MANNIFAGRANAGKARETISFAAADLDETNISVIYLVDGEIKSFVPGRTINAIEGFESGRGYLVTPLIDIDVEDYFIPPIPVPPAGNKYVMTDGDQVITVSNPADYAFAINTPFSVAFYIRIPSAGNFTMGRSGVTNGDRVWDLTVYANGSQIDAECFIAGHDGAYFYKNVSNIGTLDTWLLFQFVYDTNDVYMAVNGNLVGTSQNSGTVTAFKAGGAFAIGRRGAVITGGGTIVDELVIIDRALNPTELAEMNSTGNINGVGGLAWENDVIGFYQFTGNLNDNTGVHNGTATNPTYTT